MRRWTDTGVAGWLGGRTDGLGRDPSTVTHSGVTFGKRLNLSGLSFVICEMRVKQYLLIGCEVEGELVCLWVRVCVCPCGTVSSTVSVHEREGLGAHVNVFA